MSKAEFWQRGEAIDYVNNTGAAIEANEIVVFGTQVGVAGTPIAAGETGTLHVVGVFEMPKTEKETIEAGVAVYFDSTTGSITAKAPEETPTTVPAGYATEAAAATDATVKVKLPG